MGEEAVEIFGEFLCRRVAACGLFLQTLEADGLQVHRDARIQPTRRHGISVLYLPENFRKGFALERRSPREQMIKNRAERIDVCRPTGLVQLSGGLLGRDVTRRTQHLPGGGVGPGAGGSSSSSRLFSASAAALAARASASSSALAARIRARRDSARAARDAAKARYELLRQGTRAEQVAEARAAVLRATAALAEVETVAARYTVTAPRAGIVEALPYKLGERPAAGRPVAIVLANGTPYARVYVPEPLRANFVAGTKVQATVDGSSARISGTVRYISAEAAFTPYYSLTQKDRSRLAYLAEITLDDANAAALPAGMPIQVFAPATEQ